MASRGVKFVFTEGESVLCFEPDSSNAQVLYEAKIIETNVVKDVTGKRVPEYIIHFNGWNTSWDRQVPEDLILKYNEENNVLRETLANAARGMRANTRRGKKTGPHLDRRFRKRRHSASEGSNADTQEDVDSNDESTDDGEGLDDEGDHEAKSGSGDDSERLGDGSTRSESEDEGSSSDLEINIEMPLLLTKVLQKDNNRINKKKKLVKLPSTPNIVTILEGYVKYFAINQLCSTTGKTKPGSHKWNPEKSINICKEVVDGLRIMFDFTLETVLLYNAEQNQFVKWSSSPTSVSRPIDSTKDNVHVHLHVDQTARRRRAASHSLSTRERSPTIAFLSPRALRRLENRLDTNISSDLMQATSSRRVTRRSAATNTSETSGTKDSDSVHVQPDIKKSSRPHFPLRGATRAGTEDCDTRQSTPQPPGYCLPSRSATPNPAAAACSKTGSNSDSSHENEAKLEDALAWRLVPEELYNQTPPPLSLVYGAHHLLRLFVKLPDILQRMKIPQSRLSYLCKHLDMFLQYLSSRRDDFFTDSSYVDCDVKNGQTKR